MNTAALIAAASVLLGACAATAAPAPAPLVQSKAAAPMVRDGVLSMGLTVPDGYEEIEG